MKNQIYKIKHNKIGYSDVVNLSSEDYLTAKIKVIALREKLGRNSNYKRINTFFLLVKEDKKEAAYKIKKTQQKELTLCWQKKGVKTQIVNQELFNELIQLKRG
jgi:hypothetical protein